MRMRLSAWRTAALLLFALFLFLLLLTNAPLAAAGVRQGLSVSVNTLLPTLFPFLVLSELLVTGGAGAWLGRLLHRPTRALLGLSEGGTAALLLGVLCGFPVGTAAAASMCRRGEMEDGEVKRLFLFANNPGFGFLAGAVGGTLFGNFKAGVVLWGITWASSLLIGIFLRIWSGKAEKNTKTPANGVRNAPTVADLTGCVTRGFFTLLQVFAFVIFFSCLTACLTAVISPLCLPPLLSTLLYGLPELTTGIARAAGTLSPDTAFSMAAFFAGFGGFSVCMQLFAVAEGLTPPVGQYLLVKCLQGGICFALARGYIALMHPVLRVAESTAVFAPSTHAPHTLLGVSAVMLLFLLLSLPVKKARCR